MHPTSLAPDRNRLLELIDGFGGQQILVLADLVVDRFVMGVPKRISREAPVLILRQVGEDLVPGGGANAIFNIRALDGDPWPVGIVGDDTNGRALIQIFEEHGVRTHTIQVGREYVTPCKTRVLAGGEHSIKQQVVRYDVDEFRPLSGAERQGLEKALIEGAAASAVFVASDYGFGAVDPQLAARVPSSLLRLGDSRYRLQDFNHLDGATPNEEEVEGIEGPGDLQAKARSLLERLGARFLLVTQGSHGMALLDERGAVHIPVHGTDQVADVTGAGDTVIGTLALASAAGANPLEAALLANYAGGTVVMKVGTATASRNELREAVESNPRPLEDLRWERW